jgi:hypothetical protein
VIDGQLEAADDQHRLLLQARPDSLDDATVERLVRVFTEEVDLLAVYQEQLDRWRTEQLTVAQSREVERKGGQVACNRDVAAAIHAILAKSDLGEREKPWEVTLPAPVHHLLRAQLVFQPLRRRLEVAPNRGGMEGASERQHLSQQPGAEPVGGQAGELGLQVTQFRRGSLG